MASRSYAFYNGCLCSMNLSCILFFISAKIKLLCGADMLESFAVPDLWSDDDVSVLLEDNTGLCMVDARNQTNQLLLPTAKFLVHFDFRGSCKLVTDAANLSQPYLRFAAISSLSIIIRRLKAIMKQNKGFL